MAGLPPLVGRFLLQRQRGDDGPPQLVDPFTGLAALIDDRLDIGGDSLVEGVNDLGLTLGVGHQILLELGDDAVELGHQGAQGTPGHLHAGIECLGIEPVALGLIDEGRQLLSQPGPARENGGVVFLTQQAVERGDQGVEVGAVAQQMDKTGQIGLLVIACLVHHLGLVGLDFYREGGVDLAVGQGLLHQQQVRIGLVEQGG